MIFIWFDVRNIGLWPLTGTVTAFVNDLGGSGVDKMKRGGLTARLSSNDQKLARLPLIGLDMKGIGSITSFYLWKSLLSLSSVWKSVIPISQADPLFSLSLPCWSCERTTSPLLPFHSSLAFLRIIWRRFAIIISKWWLAKNIGNNCMMEVMDSQYAINRWNMPLTKHPLASRLQIPQVMLKNPPTTSYSPILMINLAIRMIL